MNVLAQATLRANPVAVADEQHADHQLWIDGRPADLAIEGLQVPTHAFQIDEDINMAQQMIGRNVILKAKIVK